MEKWTPLIVLFAAMFPGFWDAVATFLQTLLNIGNG